jgi:hypothetical protein
MLQAPSCLAWTALLRYVTREPNLRVKRSCMGLGNLEVFLFGFTVLKDYVLGWTLFVYCMIGQTSRDRPAFRSHALEYWTMTRYDYQPELGKLHLLSVVTHWVFFGGLFFSQ